MKGGISSHLLAIQWGLFGHSSTSEWVACGVLLGSRRDCWSLWTSGNNHGPWSCSWSSVEVDSFVNTCEIPTKNCPPSPTKPNMSVCMCMRMHMCMLMCVYMGISQIDRSPSHSRINVSVKFKLFSLMCPGFAPQASNTQRNLGYMHN